MAYGEFSTIIATLPSRRDEVTLSGRSVVIRVGKMLVVSSNEFFKYEESIIPSMFILFNFSFIV